ncbi:MAG: 2-isopropylmalate synthase [Salinivirgaceae bacterium]|nr:2-isopropylmalate synthase [Salinivirgaceae bacterium]
MRIEILDTTLRDGEQMSGVAFSADEKLSLSKLLLEDLKVDRLEVASARVSEGEFEAVRKVCDWARQRGFIDRIEVLGFVDGETSIDWIQRAGCKVINLLAKGSLKHCEGQLRKTPEQHLTDVRRSIELAHEHGLGVNIYLEDWSGGMRTSPDYVFAMVDALKDSGIQRFMLPDTLGILNPDDTYNYLSAMRNRYPDLKFDFHPHNDYDLATANVYAAIKAGIASFHATINGLGERAGNVTISSIIAIVKDHFGYEVNADESKLYRVSRMVEMFSGIRIPTNKPIIGENVFTQTAGIHADGDNKNNLYCNALVPERFGRHRTYALGKTSGKANIKKNLEEMGIELDDDAMRKVTQRIIELGDKKETVTPEDLPFIISDVLRSQSIKDKIDVVNFNFSTAKGLKSIVSVMVKIDGQFYKEAASGDGQYDAFMSCIKKIYSDLNKPLPKLVDYNVTIPPGGRTDALVQTTITWQMDKEFRTRGLDPDQTMAAIKATIKMLNIIEE